MFNCLNPLGPQGYNVESNIFSSQGTEPSKWIRDEDYYRMDGSTGAEKRRKFTCDFNNVKNERFALAIFIHPSLVQVCFY